MSVLAADVGGTHARLACAASASGLASAALTLSCDDFDDPEAVIEHALARAQRQPDAIAVSVAGPVSDRRARLTNRPWIFDADALGRRFGVPVHLVNDFEALARSLPELSEDRLRMLGGAPAGGLRAVLGPGTGLGTALMDTNGPRVYAAEGGHVDFAPTDALEMELLGVLLTRFERVSLERVLSGPGLVNLYEALCVVWDSAPEALTAETISARGLAGEPVCHQCLEVFAGALGAAAGNLVLATGARGGLYLAGGLSQALVDFLAASPFRERFEDKGRLSEWIRPVATSVILDSYAGLRGAWLLGRDALSRDALKRR